MSRPTSQRRQARLRTCLAGVAGAAVVAGVLAPAGAHAATPSPSPTPTASASATATPTPTSTAGARPVLAAPALLGPVAADDAVQAVVKDVVLAWSPVSGALGYRVQVSQDGDFSDDVTLDLPTVATSLALPGWLPHASYRWRVAATQAAGHGFWSAAGAFTKGWRDRPTPLTPVGDVDAARPVYSWTPVAGASEYEVQVSDSPAFVQDPTRLQAAPGTVTCFTVRTSFSPATAQATSRNGGAGDCNSISVLGEDRYWRVRALDHVADAAQEVDTTPVKFEGVTYLPPASEPGALDLTACPVAAASPSAVPAPSAVMAPEPLVDGGVASVAPSASPSAPAAASASPSATAGSLTGCTPANTVESGSWSAVSTFRVLGKAPGPVSAATYADVPVGVSPELCSERPAADDGGRGYDCTEFPTLSWAAREGAYRYRVYVALDDAFTNIQEVVETSALSWTPTTAWRDTTAASSYYFAVQACTPVRCGTVPSSPDNLRKKSPRTALTTPTAATVIGATDVELRWKPFSSTQRSVLSARAPGTAATEDAYAYRVQVAAAPQDGRPATDEDFQDTVEDVTVDGTVCRPGVNGTLAAHGTTQVVQPCTPGGPAVVADPALDEVSYVSPLVRYPTGSYVWRVQALDASAHKLPWSPVGTFTRDITAPVATLPGAALAVDAPLVVRFSEPVSGVSVSTVSLAPHSASLVLAADGRSVTLRPRRTWVPGQAYALALGAGITDRAGNPLPPVTTVVRVSGLVDDSSPALVYAGSWSSRTSSNAVGGGFHTSLPLSGRQTAVTVTVAGSTVLVTGCVSPGGGLADLWLDGTKRTRVDTYRSYSGCGVVLARLAAVAGVHQVQVRGVGLKRAASRGTAVSLDAVRVL